MDFFSPSDQPFPPNGNGQSANGLPQKKVTRNGFSKTDSSDETAGSEIALSSGSNDAPEIVPVFEDQGERFDKARNSAMKVYAVLILAGVIIGAITLFGIVMVMQHFGLTDVPVPVEQK